MGTGRKRAAADESYGATKKTAILRHRTSDPIAYLELLCMIPIGQKGVRSETAEVMQINKDLIAASSTPMILAILAESDSYGYAILQRVRELSGGRLEWTDGMLYPILHRLERLHYVEARWETSENGRRRKYYRITTQGRKQLMEERTQWQAVDSALRNIWQLLSVLLLFLHLATAPLIARGV